MVNHTKRIQVIDATTLDDAVLDAVVGGRIKLLRPTPGGTPSGGAGSQPIDIQWAGYPNYLGPF